MAGDKYEFTLEQYRQAFEQRARNAGNQWRLLTLGTSALGGLLVFTLSTQDPVIATYLAALAVPLSLFLYIAYRKQVYFEDMYGESIEAIEKSIENMLHVQYDTVPHQPQDTFYITRQPKKFSAEIITLHTVFNVFMFILMLSSALFLYVQLKYLILWQYALAIAVLAHPILYIVVQLLNTTKRIGKHG